MCLKFHEVSLNSEKFRRFLQNIRQFDEILVQFYEAFINFAKNLVNLLFYNF